VARIGSYALVKSDTGKSGKSAATVKEEKRSRIDNQPYMPAAIQLEEKLFDNWSNQHPVIGYFEDLEASSINDVKDFFKTYYAPNNATMALLVISIPSKYMNGLKNISHRFQHSTSYCN